MPVRFAIQNGNFSNTATWNYGSVLGIPTGSDDIFANAFTVNVDQSFNALTLNSVASFGAVATPTMTSNTTPSPYSVNASNELNGAAWSAFDRNTTTSWATTSGAGGVANIIFDFSAADARIIKSYSIYTPSVNSSANPRVWTFDGSNNGSTWITLDTVTLGSSIGASSVYNSSILANTTAYRYYRLNVTATTGGAGVQVGELALWETGSAFISAGGSFNFNSGSISGSATTVSTGATNLITVTANSGTVILSCPLGPTSQFTGNILSYTGNCDLIITGSMGVGFANTININKSSTGTLILLGNIGVSNGSATTLTAGINQSAGTTIVSGSLTGNTFAFTNSHAINQTGGTVIVSGSVTGTTLNAAVWTINQTGGNLIVNGNVTGGSSNASAFAINSTATSLRINGNILGGTGAAPAAAVNTTAPMFVTGNISGSAAAGIITTAPLIVTGSVIATGAAAAINAGANAVFINVSGSVIASANQNAIIATNASAVVNLAGNIVNVNGKQAIYCQNLFLDNTATTQARFFTFGGSDRTLYSADTFPNLPSTSNVRFGTTYGPGSGNTGTLRMASSQDVRSGVLTDNTTGSAILSMESLSNEIQTSSDPFAQRLKNLTTVDIIGNLLIAFKK